ncbi:MAG: glycosyltransferase family 4 protein [Planctomycetota bacterium]|jgi:glycosyltransferase involved in cell wall biosynthesis
MNTKTKVIKICFVAPKAYPLFNQDVEEVFGGAEVDLYFVATELVKDRNFDVSFITADYGQEKCETIEGIKVIKSVDFQKNALHGAIRFWQALREADAEMYMIKTISPGMFLLALFCQLKSKAFLYRTSNTNSCDGTYLRQHPLLGRIYKWALRSAKIVFVQNRTDKDSLERTTSVTSVVIPNGHRLKQLTEDKRDTILWIGRSAQIKKPEIFTELVKTMPAERFTMICQKATGDNRYERLIARTRNLENLELIERVGFGETDSYFQRAKVFVNTSEAEGFPNTFIQACYCGTPILSLNVNPDGFLDEYDCGICCGGDFNKFVNSLKLMLKENRHKQMGINARKYVQQHHNITKIAEKYKDLFGELVGNGTICFGKELE